MDEFFDFKTSGKINAHVHLFLYSPGIFGIGRMGGGQETQSSPSKSYVEFVTILEFSLFLEGLS